MDTLMSKLIATAAACLLIALPSLAPAALPAPTPQQAQAAAEKKAQAQIVAEKEKQALLARMDVVTERWRSRAASEGWQVRPPVAIAAAAPAAAPAQAGTAGALAPASPVAGAGPAPTAAAPAAAAAVPPIRSEKAGTAPPSEDVKKVPTGKVPQK
jgi:hypothetical protein